MSTRLRVMAPEQDGHLSGNFRPMALLNRIAQIEKGATTQVRVSAIGTSVAYMKFNELYQDLAAACGGFAGSILKTGSQNNYNGVNSTRSSTGLTYTDTGTVTKSNADSNGNDPSYWHGPTYTLSAGATRSVGVGGVSATFDHAEGIYIIKAGGGTLSVAVAGSTVGSVDTSAGTAGAIGFYSIPVASRATQSLVLTASGGPVTLVDTGVGLWDSTVTGLITIGAAAPGLTYANLTTQALTNLTAFRARYLPDLTLWEAKGGQWSDGVSATQLTRLLDALRAGAPRGDVILIGSTPDSGGAVPGGGSGVSQIDCNQLAERTAAAYAKTNNFNVTSWDGYSPLISYAMVQAIDALMVANGETAGQWQGDGIHLGWRAQAYLANLLWRDLGIEKMFRSRIAKLLGYFSTAVRIGPTPSAPTLSLESDTFDLDNYAYLKRWWRIRASGSSTDYMLIDPTTGTSFVPQKIRVGSTTGPTLKAISNIVMAVTRGDSVDSPCDLWVRSIAPQVVNLANQSGTVTLDLSAGSTFIVNLTGSVTSWAFSNFSQAGQLITIHWVQDSTGGHTVAGANASIKLRSGFALGTTASKRSTVMLQQVSGGYYQMGVEAADLG